MKKVEKVIELKGRKITLTTGHLAARASGAVMASCGETVVLATVVAAPLKQEWGYFPLMVDYRERLYAGGKIKGSRWVKREGRPLEDEILLSRLIDRSIRPLFPENYKKEVQVIITLLSVDGENSPDTLSAVAVSAAIAASSIPWEGPVATVKVGVGKDDKFITNPTESELKDSSLELVVSGTKDAIVMIEAGGNQVTEDVVIDAIEHAQKEITTITTAINDFAKQTGIKKDKVAKEKTNVGIESKVKKLALSQIKDLIKKVSLNEVGYSDIDEVKKSIADNFDDKEKNEVFAAFTKLYKSEVRKVILSGKRSDGRKSDEIRKLSSEVGVLPRTHGSGLFERGQTQVLTTATLGAPSLELLIESAEGEDSKRYIHHYNFPPSSVGEVGFMRGPGRRELGHGALAEKALLPVIPSEDDFPYTIIVVSEVLTSNGSTSMASTCGSTLSLMDAGVPIKEPVSGIAMGLIIESKKKFIVLTDITGLEDGNGDMDFKVAGTKNGITALQLDVKTLNLTLPILKEALGQAKDARMQILETMLKTLSKPRSAVSVHAPKIKVIKIDIAKIGEVIGPGGKTIRRIIAETGAQVDVEDDGSVFISGMTKDEVDKAVEMVEGLVKEVEPGEIYEGEVKRIQPFGAFVEVLPGKDGLVHVSDMSEDFVKDPGDVVKIGDKVKVKVKEIDNLGRINLTMLIDSSGKKQGGRGSGGGGYQDNKGKPRRSNRGKYDNNRNKKSSGPHFPTSRLVIDKDNIR